ncbi:deoxyuridine 5'-triphosphate nucleotidohydrolase [Flavobacteriales bacterium 34_180_T64]|nr:deoxyuridine 5'-triphosphate nucleotidohydrolase [Flavobacteriales bacterium 34_180_T64]
MKLLKYSLLVLLIGVLGCKSTKSITNSSALDSKLSAKQIIRENSKKAAKFKRLQTKVKIAYTQDNKAHNYTVNLRMEKDKTIWISATLGLARAMITPEKVRFYDKINNQYFDGDYTLLSNLLGIDLDFDKVQSLLLGESIYNLKDDTYIASINEVSYILQPKDQKVLLELFLLFNPAHFKMDSQQLYQPLKKRFLQIDYTAYQEIEKQVLPKTMKIIAVENTDEVLIDMEFKSVSLNQELRFPFRIPSGFKEIVLANEK